MNEDRTLNRREFLTATMALAGCWPSLGRAHAQPSGTADVIFRGGPILTMNKNRPRAEAVAVRGQRILAVGAFEDLEARRDSRTRIVDLGGCALLPGFIDAHMHFSSVTYYYNLTYGDLPLGSGAAGGQEALLLR
jgi:predicted amidohydrolase